MSDSERAFHIIGTVIDRETRQGVDGLRVEAWDRDLVLDDMVGSTMTDDRGGFRIEFDASHFREIFFDRMPDLFFRIYRGTALVESTERATLWSWSSPGEEIIVEVDLARTTGQPTDAEGSLRAYEAAVQPVSGILVDAVNEYPLAGLRVTAHIPHDDGKEILLGEGVSDPDGHFAITFRDTPEVFRRVRELRLSHAEGPPLVLRVERDGGEPYLREEVPAGSASTLPVTLPVALTERPVPRSTWEELGRVLEEARLVRLHEIAQRLVQGGSYFAGWETETRHGVLAEIEAAFVDPTGALRAHARPPGLQALQAPGALEQYAERLRPHLRDVGVRDALAGLRAKRDTFASLFEVDWVIEPRAFARADPGAAVAAFQQVYSGPSGPASADGVEELGEKADDPVCYRDYLRAVWTLVARRGGTYDPATSIDQLDRRFHQEFRTTDLTPRPANEILIGVVAGILTAPGGSEYGFGIPPGGIAARGTRSARVYLDYLIGLSGLSARELSLRYRVDLERPDAVLSTEVHENIATLQRFFRDGFQCEPEPVPMVPQRCRYKAPFFLEYEEWLRSKAPFHPENFFRIDRAVLFDPSLISSRDPGDSAYRLGSVKEAPQRLRRLHDALTAGAASMAGGNPAEAHRQYTLAAALVSELFKDPAFTAVRFSGYPPQLSPRAKTTFSSRSRRKKIGTLKELDDFTEYFPRRFRDAQAYEAVQYSLVYLAACVLPTLLGDSALAMGSHEAAVKHYRRTLDHGFMIGMANPEDPEGYRESFYDWSTALRLKGVLPYTFSRGTEDQRWPDKVPYEYELQLGDLREERPDATWFVTAGWTNAMEKRFFRLRLGNAMLEWADTLYRTDVPAKMARARELYKGVLLLHGETPAICPSWPRATTAEDPADFGRHFFQHTENPALTLQKNRARLGFAQLEAGLNYYGLRDDLVPLLRYRAAKEAADRFAGLAKAAQTDFLAYVGKAEELVERDMLLSHLRRKAALQAEAAGHQIPVAEHAVQVAKEQREAVLRAIDAKNREIEDRSSFWGELGDYVGGMKSLVTSLSLERDPDATSKPPITETREVEVMGALKLSGAAGIMAGFAAFWVFSYVTLQGMSDAHNQRVAERDFLLNHALPAADAAIEARRHEVSIARLQRQIAHADADLAADLAVFQATRFLNQDFWSHLAALARRLLGRYLDLAARAAWLAERALAYEQDRPIDIVRLDYFPRRFQGVTGADLLISDLAEMEALRIGDAETTVPVKHTFSLARDFPVQFAELRSTGRCTFRTDEATFRHAYPGTYGYRLRAVTTAVEMVAARPPARGLLVNQGISNLSDAEGNHHASVRPPQALPLSEHRLREDMAVYGLPDDALFAFEGSGVETFWRLELPSSANPYGLADVSDVLVTLEARARFSATLYEKHVAAAPRRVQRLVFASALRLRPASLAALSGGAAPDTVVIDFDLAAMGLPTKERDRRIRNLVVFVAGEQPADFSATVLAAVPPTSTTVTFREGTAFSNAPVAPGIPAEATPLPLNTFVGSDAAQAFTLTIQKSKNPGVDFTGVTDVILGVEYSADLLP